MMENGAETGVYDIDKLGDAMKEFGIRSKDGSDTSSAAFETLGFDAEEMTKKFAEGGETSKEAFAEMASALSGMDDQVAQNEAGVALFGTMWEDLGADAILALSDTQGEISKTSDALEDIENIKYDDLGSAFTGIGRQLEVGLLDKLESDLLPRLNDFGAWVDENMPQIQSTMETILDAICTAFGFVADNINIILPLLIGAAAGFAAFSIITTIVPMVTALQAAIGTYTGIQAAMNAVMAANPIGAVALAIGLLVAAGVALWMNWDTIKLKCEELFAKISETFANIKTDVVDKIEEVKTYLDGKVADFKNTGKAIFTGMWEGLQDVWEGITSWVTEKIEWLQGKLDIFNNLLSAFQSDDDDDDSDGSHRTGLAEVPYDGYRAILHKGERVLTQPEADRLDQQNVTNEGAFTVNIGNVNNSSDRNVDDLTKRMEFVRKQRRKAMGVT